MTKSVKYGLYYLLTAIFTIMMAINPSESTTSWSNWSAWSGCSKTCQNGVRSRTRFCDKINNSVDTHISEPIRKLICPGKPTEFSICAKQPCIGMSDHKKEQCNLHTGRQVKGLVINSWIPNILVTNPCQLSCYNDFHKLSYSFGKVEDGTRCSEDGSRVCFNGRCMTVGCDLRIGSKLQSDMCGICGGLNDTCRLVKKNVFSQSVARSSEAGMHYGNILTIPSGSTNIIIDGYRVNLLAFRDSYDTLVMNGSIFTTSKMYQAVGATFRYFHERGFKRRLESKGPTTDDLHVSVLNGHDDPGISYAYWVPISKTNEIATTTGLTSTSSGTTENTASLVSTTMLISRTGIETDTTTSLPEPLKMETTAIRKTKKKKRSKKKKKPKKIKGKKCKPCIRTTNIKQQFCESEFVLRAVVFDVERISGETRYELQVVQSFKNLLTIQRREFIWVSGECHCPKLRKGHEYIVMVNTDNEYLKREVRLIANSNSYVRRYTQKTASKITKLQRDRSKVCPGKKKSENRSIQ